MFRKANPFECLNNKILIFRGQIVLLDEDLAKFYGKRINQIALIVKKHRKSFPPEIMFQLNRMEFTELKSHFTTSKIKKRQQPPLAFTRGGVIKLSGLLGRDNPQTGDTCSRKCIVYSRVSGYLRPVRNWNRGKKEEFKDRKCFIIPPFKIIESKEMGKGFHNPYLDPEYKKHGLSIDELILIDFYRMMSDKKKKLFIKKIKKL